MCLICPKPAALSASISVIFCPFCRHTVGDTKVPFCLQSCVKPLKYAVAVNDYGTEYVHSFIGKEPSGLRFNKLFLDEDGEPFSLSLSLLSSPYRPFSLLKMLQWRRNAVSHNTGESPVRKLVFPVFAE